MAVTFPGQPATIVRRDEQLKRLNETFGNGADTDDLAKQTVQVLVGQPAQIISKKDREAAFKREFGTETDGVFPRNEAIMKRKADNSPPFVVVASDVPMEEAITRAHTFVALHALLKNALPNVSFWGQRYVHILGHKGTMQITNLVDHVMTMIDRNSEVSEEEQKAGKEIVGFIDRLYISSDYQTDYVNRCTRLFCSIRDWWIQNIPQRGCFFTLDLWKKHSHKYFNYYTLPQSERPLNNIPQNEAIEII